MAHHDCGTLPFGYIVDFYSIALNNVFFQVANHPEIMALLALVLAI